MWNTMRWMLSALVCVLADRPDISPVSNFDLAEWYMVGSATNVQRYVKADMKMGTATFVPTGAGDLNVSYATLNANDSCSRKTYHGEKTSTPGRFTFGSQVTNTDKDVVYVDVAYKEYAVAHIIQTKNGEEEVLNQLYCRSPVASEIVQQKFIEFSLKTCVEAGNVKFFFHGVECDQN